jgi:FSR family fosmidomycin resistance protein-like MFS transporter
MKPGGKAALSVLLMVSLGHFLNDMFQSVIPSIYPMLKESYGLTFLQVGAITLVNQLTSSLLQPLVGYYSDKHPRPYGLALGMCFTLTGIVLLSMAWCFEVILLSVALVGCGSSVLHPESSKVARMASGGAKGLAQSIFQLGGNAGRAFGPLVVALLVVPQGQRAVIWFSIPALFTIFLLSRIGRWYKSQLLNTGKLSSKFDLENATHLTRRQVVTALVVLLVLMFSKDFYTSNLQNYLTFYMIEKFGLTVQSSQYVLFAFLLSTAIGLIIGGEMGDRYGHKYVIWCSILGSAPFALVLPYCGMTWTIVLAIIVGMVMSSAMSAILVYATDLLPGNVGMISGAFFGLSFGLGGIGSAIFGWMADVTSIQQVFQFTAYLPLLGVVAYFLPDLKVSNSPK